MAYNDFGKRIPSKAEKETGLLTFGDIGGVGQLVYHNLRFADYTLKVEGTETLAVPVISAEAQPDMKQKKNLDGNRILTSLCDLARKIDSFETKERYQDLILGWCLENMHPYRIDSLFLLLSDEADVGLDILSGIAVRDAVFSIQDFMKDLGALYNAVRFKNALDGVAIAEEDDAYNLYEVGRFFEAPAILERYKLRVPQIPDSVFNGNNDEDILNAMQREQEYENAHPQKELAEGLFANEPYDDYEELSNRLLEMFPDFKLRLRANPKDGRIVLSAEVDSAFDIAWYALAHLITEEPLPQDMGKPIVRSEGIMATCKSCGRFFIRRNSRNQYCDRGECQKARNARNQRDFRKRRAVEKAQGKARTQNSIQAESPLTSLPL